jgi:hypothetical protein
MESSHMLRDGTTRRSENSWASTLHILSLKDKTPFSVARCLLSRIIATTERYYCAYVLLWECCCIATNTYRLVLLRIGYLCSQRLPWKMQQRTGFCLFGKRREVRRTRNFRSGELCHLATCGRIPWKAPTILYVINILVFRLRGNETFLFHPIQFYYLL